MPDAATISALRGRVDFYWWNGIACARSWPIYRERVPSEAEALNRQKLATVSRDTGRVDGFIQQIWAKQTSRAEGLSWFDGWRSVALGKDWTVVGGS